MCSTTHMKNNNIWKISVRRENKSKEWNTETKKTIKKISYKNKETAVYL